MCEIEKVLVFGALLVVASLANIELMQKKVGQQFEKFKILVKMGKNANVRTANAIIY